MMSGACVGFVIAVRFPHVNLRHGVWGGAGGFVRCSEWCELHHLDCYATLSCNAKNGLPVFR